MTTARANYNEAVGAAMRQARQGANPSGDALTLTKMAAKLRQRHVKVHQPDLSNYERGKDRPPERVVVAYARVLGFTDDLALYRRAFGPPDDYGHPTGQPIRHYGNQMRHDRRGDRLVPPEPAQSPLAHAA